MIDRPQIDSNISNGLRLELKEIQHTNKNLKLLVKLMNVSGKPVTVNRVVVTPEALRVRFISLRHKVIHFYGDDMAMAFPDRLVTIEVKGEIKFERDFIFLGKDNAKFITATTSYPRDSRFPGAWSGELVIKEKRL